MRAIALLVPCVVLLAACDTKAKDQLATLAHADSLRTDSLVSIKNDLLNEVMTSTQFVNDMNDEMAKLKSRTARAKLNTKLTTESDISAIKEERAAVVAAHPGARRAARLERSPRRLAARRASNARRSTTRRSSLRSPQYEKTIADLRQTVDQQKAEYEAMIPTPEDADRVADVEGRHGDARRTSRLAARRPRSPTRCTS